MGSMQILCETQLHVVCSCYQLCG